MTRLLPLVLAFLIALTACGDGDEPPPAGVLDGDITVFAAASLTDAFTAAAEAFEAAHPGVDVALNFASSSALATQINEGAPADVFAAADQNQMQVVIDAAAAAGSEVFATNLPVVIVPHGSGLVTSFAGLAEDRVLVVLAAEDVPIGRYSREILENASNTSALGPNFAERVLENLVSNEPNVRAVLTRVQLGEADAGIVYATDAAAESGEVDVIEIPDEFNVVATYPITVLEDASNPEVARAFVDFILSADGQAILLSFGFQAP